MNGDPPIEDPRQAVWNEMMDKMRALEAERDVMRAAMKRLGRRIEVHDRHWHGLVQPPEEPKPGTTVYR